MGRHLAANAITFLILGLVVALGVVNWAKRSYEGPGPLTEATVVDIPRGATLDRIASELAQAGAISNQYLFKTGVHLEDLGDQMKFGVYEFPAGASMKDIAARIASGAGAGARYVATYGLRLDGMRARLSDQVEATQIEGEQEEIMARIEELVESGDSLELRVAIPEGLTSWQIVEGLKAVPILDGEIAEVPAEGALAPNTFSVRRGSDRQGLIDQMVADQQTILAAAWESRNPDVPLESPEDLLTLASIIEKETGVAEERGKVASVFANRLERGMLLQTDPTVIYGVTGGKEVLGRGLRRSELDRDTPYNTYVNPGLPPTPIANPGRASIEAAANPEETDLLFFVADGTGGHAFAETLAEHERNVAVWREIEARNAESQ